MTPAAKAKVVFDTNTVLSAILFTHSRLSWLVNHWQSGGCIPVVSQETTNELIRVLAYPKFKLSAEEQLEVLAAYIPYCEPIEIKRACPVRCRDSNDQPLLNLAYSAKSTFLITGDKDLLVLADRSDFVIETAQSYRLRVSGAPHS